MAGMENVSQNSGVILLFFLEHCHCERQCVSLHFTCCFLLLLPNRLAVQNFKYRGLPTLIAGFVKTSLYLEDSLLTCNAQKTKMKGPLF